MIDRKKFFDNYRYYFGKVRQTQVDGLNFLLDKFDASTKIVDKRWRAYILSTIKHETAETYQPVTEYGSQAYLKSKKYYPYIGRGYVQLTWFGNYETFEKLLGIPLTKKPDLAKDPETAWKILEIGMTKGLFTGKKLSDYINSDKTDYRNARRIINGTDRMDLLKDYAVKFEKCL